MTAEEDTCITHILQQQTDSASRKTSVRNGSSSTQVAVPYAFRVGFRNRNDDYWKRSRSRWLRSSWRKSKWSWSRWETDPRRSELEVTEREQQITRSWSDLQVANSETSSTHNFLETGWSKCRRWHSRLKSPVDQWWES